MKRFHAMFALHGSLRAELRQMLCPTTLVREEKGQRFGVDNARTWACGRSFEWSTKTM